MNLVYREGNDGPFRVADVATREAAVRYEPYIVMPDASSAENLRNHLAGHDKWQKKDCPICRPAKDETPPDPPAPAAELDDAAAATARLARRKR